MTVQLPWFPAPLRWLGEPVPHVIDEQGLSMTAPARTDRVHTPTRDVIADSAPALLADVTGVGDYQLSARVHAEFASDYDAGVLLLWAGPTSYAKLCFEISPQRQRMAVSVVTRGLSDDANGFTVDDDYLWMRIAKVGTAYAFHASADGSFWQFVRVFDLGADTEPELGFQAQSPFGEGCQAHFTDIRFVQATLTDLRDGS